MDTSGSPMLSTATRRTLDRHIQRALRQRFGAGGNLRHAVRKAVLELARNGASADAIRAFLTRAVQNHPQRYQWDRTSIVTGVPTSVILTRRMLDWADPTPAEPPVPISSDPNGGR